MATARTVICACRVLCVALIDCNKTTSSKLIILMDNTFLQLESLILGLQALCIRVTKTLVRNCLPPARGTNGALMPLHTADQGLASFTLWPDIWGPVQEPTGQGIQKIDQYGFQQASTHNTVFDIIGILTVRQAWDWRGKVKLVWYLWRW